MRQFFHNAVLRFYPAEFREAFAAEMIETHQQACLDARSRGPLAYTAFSARELTGLLRGLCCEWAAKWTARETYVTSNRSLPPTTDCPPEIAQLQTRLHYCIRSMESAIAHHDFPKARFYANEERIARAQLQRLLNEYSFPDGLPV